MVQAHKEQVIILSVLAPKSDDVFSCMPVKELLISATKSYLTYKQKRTSDSITIMCEKSTL